MKKFIYTIGIALLATLAACSDSNKYDGITEGSDGMITISLGVDASQNSERLAFAGDAAKISVTFEEGDEIYLYKNSTLVTNNAGNPLVFKWVENDGSTGKFQLRMADSPATTTFLEETFGSGVFNAVLVGNNSDIATVPDDKFNSVVTAPSTSGTQTGTGDMAHLSIVAGVMKSYSEIGFVADGQIYKSDGTFHFDADYSIIEVILTEPEVAPKAKPATDYAPASINFAMNLTNGKSYNFELEIKNAPKSWEYKAYIPLQAVEGSSIKNISVYANNDATDLKDFSTYYASWTPQNVDYNPSKVYTVSKKLSGKLYVTVLADNPDIVKNAPNNAILTLWDGDGSHSLPTIDTYGKLRPNMQNPNHLIGFNFPLLKTIDGVANPSLSGGAFYNMSSIYWVSALECNYLGANAFKNCPNITFVNLPKINYVGSESFALVNNTVSKPLKVILGTEVPEGTLIRVGTDLFLYRFVSDGRIGPANYQNNSAGIIDMELGYAYANGYSYTTGGSSPINVEMRVTVSKTYSSGGIAPGSIGHYWWISTMNNTTAGAYGKFNSINVVPYPELPSDGEISGNAPEFGNGGTLDK